MCTKTLLHLVHHDIASSAVSLMAHLSERRSSSCLHEDERVCARHDPTRDGDYHTSRAEQCNVGKKRLDRHLSRVVCLPPLCTCSLVSAWSHAANSRKLPSRSNPPLSKVQNTHVPVKRHSTAALSGKHPAVQENDACCQYIPIYYNYLSSASNTLDRALHFCDRC